MILRALASVALLAITVTTAPSQQATITTSAAPSAAPSVTVSAPADRVEGDRYQLTIRIREARAATRVSLLQQTVNVFGELEWTAFRSVPTRGRARIQVAAVADELDVNRYRARVRYADGRTETSRPVAVRIWHWYDLHRFPDYYETAGIADNEYQTFAMNGDQWIGW